MRKFPSLRLLVGVAVCVGIGVGSVFAGVADRYTGISDLPSLQREKFAKTEYQKGTLSVTRKDVDVSLKGKMRQDWLGYDKIFTLHASNDDQYSAFRSKLQFDIDASYGKQRYGRSAADARLRLTNYGYWKREGRYTPLSDGSQPLNMLTYMEEMWINLHLGVFLHTYDEWFSYEKHPVSIKVGYFPYQLGRGISFGDHNVSVPYMGWHAYFDGLADADMEDTRFNHPGILVHGHINKDICYHLYYTKQMENSRKPSLTMATIHSDKTDGRRQWRGISSDRDLWAARMDMKHNRDWGDIHVQPYGMYVDAPELQIEAKADSNARLGTVGMMMEYKKGNFKMNAEVAGQFGHQNVHAIDRNQQEVDCGVDGISRCYHTHVFAGAAAAATAYNEVKAPVGGPDARPASAGNVNLFINKGGMDSGLGTVHFVPAVTKNGDQLFLADGGTGLQTYLPDGAGGFGANEVYNSLVTGNERFRDQYRVCYRGFMGMIDMKYKFEKVPVTIAAAGAYFSGGKYPFNHPEQCKRYKGFIPYGDKNYIGKYVISQLVLDGRKLPRPVGFSYNKGYALNATKDLSNLMYLGLGAKWKPFKDKDKLKLSSNLLWFWQTTDHNKWNKNVQLPTSIVGARTWRTDRDGIWYDGDGNRKGWELCEYASRMLGTELNFEVKYRPVKNCILYVIASCFIPGQLYKDLGDQPNEHMMRSPLATQGVFGLGHDPVWRIGTALFYTF